MQSILTQQILNILARTLSITGLVLAIPFCFAFRNYLRFLDHLQLLYLYAMILAPASGIFSNYLSNVWVDFDKNLFFFCVSGELVCTAGFALSFGACLLVFLLAMRVIVAIETCRKKDIRFQPVYTFFKGLTRWIYAPLSYWSIYFLIKSIQSQSNSLISSIVILSICLLFPIAQLTGYKLIQTQKDNIWRKWLQFLNFYRILLICGLMALGSVLGNVVPYYVVYGVYVVYAVLYTVKHGFLFRVVGRVVFVFGEVLMVGCYSLFLFKLEYLRSYRLDFILAAVVLLIDLIYYISKLVSYYQNGVPNETQSQKVAPQASQQRIVKKNKRNNSYQIDLNDVDNEFNNSREDIKLSPQLKQNKSGSKAPPNRRR